ncbi:hypothetical protein GCM10020255_024650 [Rhodococcus baikonurensis]
MRGVVAASSAAAIAARIFTGRQPVDRQRCIRTRHQEFPSPIYTFLVLRHQINRALVVDKSTDDETFVLTFVTERQDERTIPIVVLKAAVLIHDGSEAGLIVEAKFISWIEVDTGSVVPFDGADCELALTSDHPEKVSLVCIEPIEHVLQIFEPAPLFRRD